MLYVCMSWYCILFPYFGTFLTSQQYQIILRYILIMKLHKQNFMQLSVASAPLTDNFARIEKQFQRIDREISIIKKNSLLMIDKINDLDPYNEVQFQDPYQLERQEPTKKIEQEQDSQDVYVSEKDEAPRHEIKKQLGNSLLFDHAERQPSLNSIHVGMSSEQGISKINVYPDNEPERSQTVLEVKQNLEKMCSVQRKYNPMIKKRKQQPQSRQSEVSIIRKSIHYQPPKPGNNIVHAPVRQIGNQSVIRQFIKDLQLRVSDLEIDKQTQNTQIGELQKQNQIFKKLLCIKEGKNNRHSSKKQQNRNKNEAQLGENRLSKIESNAKQQQQAKDLNQAPILQKQQTVQESNIISQLTKQFQQVKEYMKSKLILVDNAFEKCFSEIGQTRVQLIDVKQQSSSLSAKLNDLQQKQKQLAQNITTQKLLQRTKANQSQSRIRPFQSIGAGLYNKTKTSASEINGLNDTVQSYKNYYEDKIVEIFQEMDRIRYQYYTIMEKITVENSESRQNGQNDERDGEISKLRTIAEKISVISNPVEERLKKEINNVRKQCKRLKDQFGEMVGGLNNGSGETRTLVIKANQNKQDWKQVTQKIYKLRQQLLSYVKQLETKINTNNDLTIVIQELEVGLSQCKILNGKKVNFSDFEKCTKRIENRLNNFIRQVCEKEGLANQQQALLAKQPWFCLSCDSEIKNLTGKLGKSVYNEKFTGKKVNPESHMIRRPDTKFPSVH